jgi:hypothetical protein
MSVYTIEKVLWDLMEHPPKAQAFRADADAFLDGYPLAPSERRLLKEMDVKAIVDLRINPMLLMRAYQCVLGRDKRLAYLQQLAEGQAGAPKPQ